MTRVSRSQGSAAGRLFSSMTMTIRLVAVLLLGFGLTACSDSATELDAAAATGSASVFLTDAPSDDFDQILVTINRLELIGGGAPVTIFAGSEEVDLKELENFSDLFVHADRIPARMYSKIRMIVNRVELVRNAGESNEERFDAVVPANGKIDLNPRGPFAVSPGVDLVIEIDMDAKKSIHAHETGSHRYKFRPVVIVTIRDTIAPRKLARVHGEVTEIVDDLNFELCSTRFMATPERLETRPVYEEGGLGDRHRCMMVELDDDTGVFDSNGDPVPNPIADGEIAVGDLTTVIGRFHIIDYNHDDEAEIQPIEDGAPRAALASRAFPHRPHAAKAKDRRDEDSDRGSDSDTDRDTDTDTDTDTDRDTDTDTDSHSDSDSDTDGDEPGMPDVELVMLAYVIEMGPRDTFLTLRGIVDSEVEMDEFDFALDPGQGYGDDSVVRALLQDGTRVFTRGGYEVDDSEIIPDTAAKIDGIFSLSADDPSLLKTALVVLDIFPEFDDEVRGRIIEIPEDTRRLILDDGEDGACTDVAEDALILILVEGDEGDTTIRGDFEDLKVGWRVDAYGDGEGLECLAASTVVAFPEDIGPFECTINDDCATGEFCEKQDGMCEDLGVCSPMPEMCTLQYDPVCGCDDVTYSNACAANSAGASIASDGECDMGPVACGGIAGLECGVGEVCRYPDGECIADAMGVCIPKPDVCSDVWMPVCSCDGTTYGNECEAIVAGAIIDASGECASVP